MTPEEALDWLSEYDGVEITEHDLDPLHPGMGRAQFLVTPIKDIEDIKEDIEDTELEYFNTDDSPDQFRHIALPSK